MHYPLSPLHQFVSASSPVLVCSITARLVIDSMGHMSPITRQCRWGERPDGICMVVGSCASGFDPARNTHGDLLYSNTPILDKGQTQIQYFWEAFPASSGPSDRTTYVRTHTYKDGPAALLLCPTPSSLPLTVLLVSLFLRGADVHVLRRGPHAPQARRCGRGTLT